MNKVTEVMEVSKVTKQVKYTRITILGYIINTIYEVPTGRLGVARVAQAPVVQRVDLARWIVLSITLSTG